VFAIQPLQAGTSPFREAEQRLRPLRIHARMIGIRLRGRPEGGLETLGYRAVDARMSASAAVLSPPA
jgi:hypothetical protein